MKVNIEIKSHIIQFGFIVLVFINVGCSQTATKAEAEKQLKAFDNELIMIYDQISESEGYRVLNQLMDINDLPVPLMNMVQSIGSGSPKYRFEEHSGIYRVNSAGNKAEWFAPSDSIIVVFPYRSKHDSLANMVLSAYSEETTKWGNVMPTKLDLKLNIGSNTLFEVNLNGEVNYDIPTEMDLVLKIDNFNFSAKLRSLLNKRKARFYVDLEVINGKREVISIEVYQLHDVSDPDRSILEKTKVNWKTFPVNIQILVDNKSFDPESNNFVQEINENTSVKITSQLNGAGLGEVKLNNREGVGKLNYNLTFADGSSVFIEDFLLAYKYLMNARYPDVPISRK